MQVVPLIGSARPSPSLLASLTVLHGPSLVVTPMPALLDDTDAIVALAQILDEGLKLYTTTDGRIDTCDLAAHVVGKLAPQRSGAVEGLVNDATAITGLARVLTEAIETRQAADGSLDLKQVAAHVLAEMRAHQRSR
jgi:hypothetical protein